MTFLAPDDPRLSRLSVPIAASEIGSPELKATVDSLFRVAVSEQADGTKRVLVGLAAPQVGILKRIILVDRSADGRGKVGDLAVYLNPEIDVLSAEMNE